MFKKAVGRLENGKEITILKDSEKPYIQSVKLNNKPLTRSYITYEEISNGATIEFVMGDAPSATWGVGDGNEPVAQIDLKKRIVPVPVFSTDKSSFQDKTRIAIRVPEVNLDDKTRKVTPEQKAKQDKPMPVQQTKEPIRVLALDNNHYEIFYTLDGRDPSPKTGIQYKEPIVIDKDVTIKAIAVDAKGHQSKVAEAHYVRYTRDKDLTYLTKPDPQYFAGGEVGLVDNLRGKVNYRIGGWQGFTTDCEVVIDLREKKPVSQVGAGCLEEQRAWIFYPQSMEVYVSEDGKNYKSFGKTTLNVTRSEGAHIQDLVVKGKANARYVKIVIKNYGKLPEWHLSAGQQSWLFVDEVWVK